MEHAIEVSRGERFEFGDNWRNFLSRLTDDRVDAAVDSLKKMLGVDSLDGKSFIDIGSGSGLFSLAARKLGAKVYSFDYDPQSVACTTELKRRYFPSDGSWQIAKGSALDRDYLSTLGRFDVVYSWGVLHHTGAMFEALNNVSELVAPGGMLFISLYNNQGGASKRWAIVKKAYNRLPSFLKPLLAVLVYLPIELKSLLIHIIRRTPGDYFRHILSYAKNRGMSWWHDKIDWIGGYPFEVSKPEQIFYFYKERGFNLEELKTCAGGLGCNEYVFRR